MINVNSKAGKKLDPIMPKKSSRYETKIAYTDELFSLIPKHLIGKLDGWEVVKEVNDIILTFGGNRRLTIQDETVMLAVLMLMGKDGLFVIPNQSDMFPEKMEMIEAEAKAKNIGIVIESRWKLLKLCNLNDTGQNFEALKKNLDRLSSTTIHYKNKNSKWEGRSWFMTYHVTDDGRLYISVNWRLAGAIYGEYHYITLDMDERTKLSSDYAKKLHVILSRMVWHGKTERYKVDTLIKHIWPDANVTPSVLKERRTKIRGALESIGELGAWRIGLTGRGDAAIAEIERAAMQKINS